MAIDGRVVCFGEMVLRLTAAGSGVLLQERRLEAFFGGAEVNVAVGLARLGYPSAMATVLPDNAIGHTARDELRRYGVATDHVHLAEGRMGLYFLTPGAVLRPSEVLYDRQGSAFAEADPGLIDWDIALAGAGGLLVSGVTPAIGRKGSDATLRAVAAANRLGIPVIFDGNYRGKLWALWDGDGAAILHTLFEATTIAFANDKDMALVLKRDFSEANPRERRRAAAIAAFDAFPRLQVITSTFRDLAGVGEQALSAVLFRRGAEEVSAGPLNLSGVVDRIGGGDAFAAGLLYGLNTGCTDTRALELGLASAAFKHSVPGDFNMATAADLDIILSGALDVRR
jgi:2-dehydro-3-deoxygluconokinase